MSQNIDDVLKYNLCTDTLEALMCGFLAEIGTDISDQDLFSMADLMQHRGPDQTIRMSEGKARFVFHRLSIMDLSDSGQQPFTFEQITVACNGEIYNDPELREVLKTDYQFKSGSDCESLLPLYLKYGAEGLVSRLDGEFAFVLYDAEKDAVFAGRDPMGIRPLFYCRPSTGGLVFASEVKALRDLDGEVIPFPPGHYYDGSKDVFTPYLKLWETAELVKPTLDEVTRQINTLLTKAVEKRLRSDAPVGFLLSGGLDSSLVCAIAARLSDRPITTFSVGIEDGPIDTYYAQEVADYLGSDHHEFLFSKEDIFDHLNELIYHLETWDITTVRASMGMSLLCRYIRKETPIKVVLTGEVSDEIFGYKYTDYAPSPEAFQEEAAKRVQELFYYDVLRADRCISMHGLEARVPFSDPDFVSYVMSVDPSLKMNSYGIGKYLLRSAFEEGAYLPKSILYREKAAFSDAVGHSMVDLLKELAERTYTDEEFELERAKYEHGTPFTKESLLYRDIFESHFSGKAELIPDFWMPNKSWENCDVDDPSARVLPNYGASGSAPTAQSPKSKPA